MDPGSVLHFDPNRKRTNRQKEQIVKPHIPWIVGIVIVALVLWYMMKMGKMNVSIPSVAGAA